MSVWDEGWRNAEESVVQEDIVSSGYAECVDAVLLSVGWPLGTPFDTVASARMYARDPEGTLETVGPMDSTRRSQKAPATPAITWARCSCGWARTSARRPTSSRDPRSSAGPVSSRRSVACEERAKEAGTLAEGRRRATDAARQRIAHMPPEGRPRIRDLRGELLVGAGDALPKVKAGNIRAPASPACIGDVTKDAGELAQTVPPALERLGRRISSRTGTSSREAKASSRCSSTGSLTARRPRAGRGWQARARPWRAPEDLAQLVGELPLRVGRRSVHALRQRECEGAQDSLGAGETKAGEEVRRRPHCFRGFFLGHREEC